MKVEKEQTKKNLVFLECIKMLEEKSNVIEIKDYGCLIYNSKSECKNCNGFGIDLNHGKTVRNCYTSLEQIKEYLGLKNER